MKQLTPQDSLLFEAVYREAEPGELEAYLRKRAGISGRSLRKYFFRGLVFVNQRKAHSAAKVKPGDIVKVLLPKEQQSLAAEDLPIEIVFENHDLLVLNKPAGMAVHPSGKINRGTLSHGVAAYFEKTGHAAKVRPVNRLDYGTSGLVIFAKSAASQEQLSNAIREHRIARIYTALVHGCPTAQSGMIDLPISEVRGRRIVSATGQPAQTNYRIVEKIPPYSLLEIRLVTGRTHQIRVHLSHLGWPVVGDPQYGRKSSLIDRPALHAGRLDFAASGFPVPPLEAPLPADFRSLIDRVKNGT